jgi:folate-binding protein YgfZ
VIARILELSGDGLHATPAEWDALRISKTFPAFGRDYGVEDNPHEASLEKLAVSFSKGCYLGQEVVCMQDMRGKVKRRLISLKLQTAATVDAGSEVSTDAGEVVGQVTSSARCGAEAFALARVRAPFFEGMTPLSVGGAPAEFVER